MTRLKGKQHFRIKSSVRCNPWFQGTNLNGLEVKILTRLRTNDGLCEKKKFMFGLESTPMCYECNSVNDLEHIILRCKKYCVSRSKFTFSEQFTDLRIYSDVNNEKYRSIVQFYSDSELDF